eukprot:4976085-Lingulodinium_polyedra.AAC.1
MVAPLSSPSERLRPRRVAPLSNPSKRLRPRRVAGVLQSFRTRVCACRQGAFATSARCLFDGLVMIAVARVGHDS